jgi:hypothetical protein
MGNSESDASVVNKNEITQAFETALDIDNSVSDTLIQNIKLASVSSATASNIINIGDITSSGNSKIEIDQSASAKSSASTTLTMDQLAQASASGTTKMLSADLLGLYSSSDQDKTETTSLLSAARNSGVTDSLIQSFSNRINSNINNSVKMYKNFSTNANNSASALASNTVNIGNINLSGTAEVVVKQKASAITELISIIGTEMVAKLEASGNTEISKTLSSEVTKESKQSSTKGGIFSDMGTGLSATINSIGNSISNVMSSSTMIIIVIIIIAIVGGIIWIKYFNPFRLIFGGNSMELLNNN